MRGSCQVTESRATLLAVITTSFPFITSAPSFGDPCNESLPPFFGNCTASKSFNMLKPCFILLFSAVSKHLSFQISSCAYRKAYTNQESVQIFKIFPDFYRLSEGYQFHLLGRNPCFYGLGSGGHPTSLFFSIVKLLPSVNHSSSAFGRGLLPRCGDGNVLLSMVSIQSCSRGLKHGLNLNRPSRV